MINFIYYKSEEGLRILFCTGEKFLFNPSFCFLLSYSIAAKFHDLRAKESALTNASLQDQLMTCDGRFVIDNKYSCMIYSEILFVTRNYREKNQIPLHIVVNGSYQRKIPNTFSPYIFV